MNREELLDWLFAALEEAEGEGELELEDLDRGEAGITVETSAGTFRILVDEV